MADASLSQPLLHDPDPSVLPPYHANAQDNDVDQSNLAGYQQGPQYHSNLTNVVPTHGPYASPHIPQPNQASPQYRAYSPQANVVVQAPPQAGYYPPTDPNQEVQLIPVPPMKVESNYNTSLCLCITWGVCLIWPAVIFSVIALYYSKQAQKDLKNEMLPEARKKGNRACLCSVVSLAVASIYLFFLFGILYVFVLVANVVLNSSN